MREKRWEIAYHEGSTYIIGGTPNRNICIMDNDNQTNNAALIVQSVNRSPYWERMREALFMATEILDGIYGGKNNIHRNIIDNAKSILAETEGK